MKTFLKTLAITCDVRTSALSAKRRPEHFHEIREHDPVFRAAWDNAITNAYPFVEAAMIADTLQPVTGNLSALHLRESAQKHRAMQILVKRHWQIQQGEGGIRTPARVAESETDEEARTQILATFSRMRERMMAGDPAGI